MVTALPGQIWRDVCYYLDRTTAECKPKYVLVLAVDPKGSGDSLTAVFTSKAHGMTEVPPCSSGYPRSGFFIGAPGGIFHLPTWVDFSSLVVLDDMDLHKFQQSKKRSLLSDRLDVSTFRSVLRCVLRYDDLETRQEGWVWSVLDELK